MIDLKQLVEAIHRGVTGAAATLRGQNLEVLEEFFEDAGERDDLEELLSQAIARSDGATVDEDAVRTALQETNLALRKAAEALQEECGVEIKPLRPKLVAMQYPQMTKKGPVNHTVLVPLIALTSISALKVSEFRFKTDLEIELVDDRLKVGFPKRRKVVKTDEESSERKSRGARAELEVLLTADTPPRGLEILIEGYERALRAQIPG